MGDARLDRAEIFRIAGEAPRGPGREPTDVRADVQDLRAGAQLEAPLTGRRRLVLAAEHVPRAAGPRSVQLFITLGPGQRACDPDNYNKSAMDALVKCRLLRDDSRQWCTILPAQFTPREPAPATTIELRELEEQGT